MNAHIIMKAEGLTPLPRRRHPQDQMVGCLVGWLAGHRSSCLPVARSFSPEPRRPRPTRPLALSTAPQGGVRRRNRALLAAYVNLWAVRPGWRRWRPRPAQLTD